MNYKTKWLLVGALDEYEKADTVERKRLIEVIENRLEQHYRAVSLIGFGMGADYVQAGLIFLRIKLQDNLNNIL